MVNKARLIEAIARLVKDKKITGISDIRDESDREGMRVVIELKRDEVAEVVLNNLYLHTQMKTSFGVINLAIVNGQPKVLNLLALLKEFLRSRKEVVARRTIFDLKKARARAHILEGLKIAIDKLDKVIKLIRASKSPREARDGLMENFTLSRIQAQAILDMKLQRLTALERDKIVEEFKSIMKIIKSLEEILASEALLEGIIIDEFKELKTKFGDERRTEIVEDTGEISIEDIIVQEDMVVTISRRGYIKRTPTSLFRIQRRGGKGKRGMTPKDEDFIKNLFIASTHSNILFFTDRGKAYSLKVYDIPQGGPAARGKAIVNILNVSPGEKITAFLPVKEFVENNYIVMASESGVIKKTDLMSFSHIRVGGLIALSLDEGDKLIAARLTVGRRELFLGTKLGKAIHFNEQDVREMGRQARGVRAVRLAEDDLVISMEVSDASSCFLTVTEHGYGKRTHFSEYRLQKRGGSGIINLKVTDKNGPVAGILKVTDSDELMITTTKGKIIRIAAKGISIIGRSTQGVRLMDIEEGEGEKVADIALIAEREEENAPE